MFVVFGLLLLNFAISFLNAWGCGRTWDETKDEGGIPHFLNWCAATMSACGFTWCYTILFAMIGAVIPITQEDGTTAMLLDEESVQAVLELGYVVVILPVLGSGLALTVNSWNRFWQRRSLGSGVEAGYNTFAQVHNTYNAVRALPSIFDHLGEFFGDSEKKDFRGVLVLIIVAVGLFGGILTTWGIINNTRRGRMLEV